LGSLKSEPLACQQFVALPLGALAFGDVAAGDQDAAAVSKLDDFNCKDHGQTLTALVAKVSFNLPGRTAIAQRPQALDLFFKVGEHRDVFSSLPDDFFSSVIEQTQTAFVCVDTSGLAIAED